MNELRLTPPAEKPVVFRCKACLGEIYDGEEYYEIDDDTHYCRDCVKLKIADVEEWF